MNSIFIAVVWAHWNESRFLHLSQRIQIQLFFWDSLHAERRKFSAAAARFLICKKCSRSFLRTCLRELMKQKLETTAATSVLRGDLWPPLQCDLVFLATKQKQNVFFFILFFFKSFFNVNSLQTEKSCLSSFAHESFLWFSFILWWQRSASVWLPSCWCQPRDTCSPRLSRFCMIQEP